jgi:AmiR/NasT family two-component response regulator
MPHDASGDHLSVQVHQATGMVAAQAGCSVGEALVRLQRRAKTMGQTLDELALDVLDGHIRFRRR